MKNTISLSLWNGRRGDLTFLPCPTQSLSRRRSRILKNEDLTRAFAGNGEMRRRGEGKIVDGTPTPLSNEEKIFAMGGLPLFPLLIG